MNQISIEEKVKFSKFTRLKETGPVASRKMVYQGPVDTGK